MFNIAVDAQGKTYNAPELVENKSEADIGNARKRKYLCMTCIGEKHPVHLKVRRKSKGSCEKTRQYTATAWFSHHGGGNNGNSEKYPNESCSETAVHCHAKHILCANVARYWYETSKCIGCPRHTKIENGVGASARVEYTEKISGGTIYIFDAVLMRGDAHNSVVHSVLEVWATHETSDEKRKYCLEKGYTFAEFHAPHVVEMHEKTHKGGTYKLENLKIREFECQQCECVRKQNEIRLEKARLQKEAAAEQARVLKAAADEQVRLTALLVQEQQQKREQVDRQFYETSTGAETRVIELQNDLHATCMYIAWMRDNFTHNSALSPHELRGTLRPCEIEGPWEGKNTRMLSCEEFGIHTASRVATIRDPRAWCDWHINAAKQEALQRMLKIKAGALKLNFAQYEKGVSFKCICAKWAREDQSVPSCKRLYRYEMEYSDYRDILQKHKVWEFNRGYDEYDDDQMSFIKTCGLCSTSCVFCGNALLLSTAVQEGQCKSCSTDLVARIDEMTRQSHMRTRAILKGLYADIDMVFHGDAFRGFFDYAIEYRVRTLAHKARMLELYAEKQRYHHRQQMLEKERIQAIQKRKMARPDNIRDILKPRAQTNTLVHHFVKTTTRLQMTKSGHESSTSFLSGPLGLPYPGYKH